MINKLGKFHKLIFLFFVVSIDEENSIKKN